MEAPAWPWDADVKAKLKVSYEPEALVWMEVVKLDVELEDEPKLRTNPSDWLESVENGSKLDPEFVDPPAPSWLDGAETVTEIEAELEIDGLPPLWLEDEGPETVSEVGVTNVDHTLLEAEPGTDAEFSVTGEIG